MDVKVLPSINKGSLLYFTLLYFTFTFTLLYFIFTLKSVQQVQTQLHRLFCAMSTWAPRAFCDCNLILNFNIFIFC